MGPVRSRASDRGLGSRFRAQFGMIRVDHMISHSPNPTTSARKQALRVMSWNVWGGGRVREITEVAQLLRIDVFAVIGCASGRVRALIAALSEVGFTHHIQSQSSLGFLYFRLQPPTGQIGRNVWVPTSRPLDACMPRRRTDRWCGLRAA